MQKKTVRDIETAEKTVLVRADFNVPLDGRRVADDTRIRAALPTIQWLVERDAKILLCSHLGRPGGRVVDDLRLDPVAERLAALLDRSVAKSDDCVGKDVEARVRRLQRGGLLLLENVRFHPEEKNNEPTFAEALAKPADLFVNDAFAAAHRAHASTEGVAHHVPAVAGLLMEEEIETIAAALESPQRPLMAILGGAKISDKLAAVDRLLEIADRVLVGGGIANTLLRARGEAMGSSLVDEEGLEAASRILQDAGDKLLLPVDAGIAEEAEAGATRRTVSVEDIPKGRKMLDLGPRTVERFLGALAEAKTIVWNGPLGVFEIEAFSNATFSIARALPNSNAQTIVGGGETAAAIVRAGVSEGLSHVSTGGGAFLALVAGEELPAVVALQNRGS